MTLRAKVSLCIFDPFPLQETQTKEVKIDYFTKNPSFPTVFKQSLLNFTNKMFNKLRTICKNQVF